MNSFSGCRVQSFLGSWAATDSDAGDSGKGDADDAGDGMPPMTRADQGEESEEFHSR